MKPTGPTNPRLVRMIENLEAASRANEAPIWKAVAERLKKPTRRRVEVDLWKIVKYSNGVAAVIVPGKVLGDGEVREPIIVAAAGFTREARRKIEEAGGKAFLLDEYVKLNPKGSHTRIVT